MAINDALRSHQVERSEVMTQHTSVEASPEVIPFQSARPCTDTETSAPTGGDVPILRLNREKEAPRDVYEALRDHQQATSANLRLLHTYLPLIIKRFYGELPLPALSWESAHSGNLGWYLEKDGLALNHRINLNSMYANRPLAEILRTLTHELGHQWQHIHGKPPRKNRYHNNYHNRQFQLKMQEIGIPCNKPCHYPNCLNLSKQITF